MFFMWFYDLTAIISCHNGGLMMSSAGKGMFRKIIRINSNISITTDRDNMIFNGGLLPKNNSLK